MNRFKALILLALLLFGINCLKNPFETRGSREPAGSTGTWEPPASPEIMLTNLIFAVNEKNIQNYRLCLTDDFVYSALEDSIAAEGSGNGYFYYDWGREVEVATMDKIFKTYTQPGNHLDLVMAPEDGYFDNIEDTLAVLYRQYTLRAVIADSVAADTTNVTGISAFHLRQSAFNLWMIYYWEEISSPGNEIDWGILKAEYRFQ